MVLQSFYYPDHVGLKIGTDDTPRYVVMETHYDNPLQRAGESPLTINTIAKISEPGQSTIRVAVLEPIH